VATIVYWVLHFNLADLRAPQKWGSSVHGTVNVLGPSEKNESPAFDLNEDAKPQTTKALDDDPWLRNRGGHRRSPQVGHVDV
jgi:hypothetical protein